MLHKILIDLELESEKSEKNEYKELFENIEVQLGKLP